jgi:hypothetical protein
VGDAWRSRLECRLFGVHRPLVARVAGHVGVGAQSIVIGGSADGVDDRGEWFVYTTRLLAGIAGGACPSAQAPSALLTTCLRGLPVRVVRCASRTGRRGAFEPPRRGGEPLRYDGIYRIVRCWSPAAPRGAPLPRRHLFVRADNVPAPWSTSGARCSGCVAGVRLGLCAAAPATFSTDSVKKIRFVVACRRGRLARRFSSRVGARRARARDCSCRRRRDPDVCSAVVGLGPPARCVGLGAAAAGVAGARDGADGYPGGGGVPPRAGRAALCGVRGGACRSRHGAVWAYFLRFVRWRARAEPRRCCVGPRPPLGAPAAPRALLPCVRRRRRARRRFWRGEPCVGRADGAARARDGGGGWCWRYRRAGRRAGGMSAFFFLCASALHGFFILKVVPAYSRDYL